MGKGPGKHNTGALFKRVSELCLTGEFGANFRDPLDTLADLCG